MNTTKPSQIANRTASTIANTLDLKSSQVAGLAMVIQAALDEWESDRALLCLAFMDGTARWEQWSDPTKGELCVNGLRFCADVDARGIPDLSPHARRALLNAREVESVQGSNELV